MVALPREKILKKEKKNRKSIKNKNFSTKLTQPGLIL